jgi:hypothetical protein
MVNLFATRVAKTQNGESIVSSTNDAGKTNKIETRSRTTHKINSK